MRRINYLRILFVISTMLFAGCLLGGNDMQTVYAAKKTTKAVTVDKARKGLKVTSGKFVYKITKVSKKQSEVSVVGFKNKSQRKKIVKLTIPGSISVAKNAFKGCNKLKKVTLSKELVSIEEAAFAGDKKLDTVVIPKDSSLEKIAKNAFKGCKKLKNINFDNAAIIKKIDDSAFTDTLVDKEKLNEVGYSRPRKP